MSKEKEAAGRRAAEMIEDGMTLGLGTGSTVYFTLVRLEERIAEEGLKVRGVPTSLDTQRKAEGFGIPLATLADVDSIDLTIDGADEIDDRFDMIKGGGGALLREKVVASISKRVTIVVGENKVVKKLGTTFDLPVEVVPFAVPTVRRALERFGASPTLRQNAGATFVTDNHNHILDCAFSAGIGDAAALERQLAMVPGVVESGLFIAMAQTAIVGRSDGEIEVRAR